MQSYTGETELPVEPLTQSKVLRLRKAAWTVALVVFSLSAFTAAVVRGHDARTHHCARR